MGTRMENQKGPSCPFCNAANGQVAKKVQIIIQQKKCTGHNAAKLSVNYKLKEENRSSPSNAFGFFLVPDTWGLHVMKFYKIVCADEINLCARVCKRTSSYTKMQLLKFECVLCNIEQVEAHKAKIARQEHWMLKIGLKIAHHIVGVIEPVGSIVVHVEGFRFAEEVVGLNCRSRRKMEVNGKLGGFGGRK